MIKNKLIFSKVDRNMLTTKSSSIVNKNKTVIKNNNILYNHTIFIIIKLYIYLLYFRRKVTAASIELNTTVAELLLRLIVTD